MPDIALRLGRDILVLDGAMGTMLQRHDLPAEQSLVQLNVTAPELVEEVHRLYHLAGADCATTNSFGGTRHKLDAYGLGDQLVELNRAAVRVARAGGAPHILAEMGPSGLVLEPLGTAAFEHVFDFFAEQASALAAEGPDAINIATMTDIAEARCAVLAARSVTDLPVFVTCTFGLNGRMDLSGTDPETAAVVLEAAGASVVGMNCGLGPEQMLPLVERMALATELPIIVRPNAGLPRLVDGKTVFPGTALEMGEYASRFVDAGAALVGSCCGSTPEFTGAIADAVAGREPAPRSTAPAGVTLAGPRGLVRIGAGKPLATVGERINPTGKKRLAESLRASTLDVVRAYAVEQQDAGADLLDVNVGAAGVSQADLLPRAVLALSGLVDLPLSIDTTDHEALEAALRIYPGRALINSVSGEKSSLEAVLPLAVRYGAAVVVLALDDDGIPHSADARVEVVHRVRAAAHAAGLDDGDLLVDALVLAAATEDGGASATLEAIHTVSADLGLATIAGVSNVSHGLPGRPELNAQFLKMAVQAGLTAAIVNPSEHLELDSATAAAAADVLLGRDVHAERWIARVAVSQGAVEASEPSVGSTTAERLALAVERGDADSAPALVEELLRGGADPQSVIADVLTPAIQRLGDAYGRGDAFLPQLIAAADAMRTAVERAKSHLPEGSDDHEGCVVFGTVKGDIHSIGKDICVSMLESQGYLVDDLGVDVSAEAFAEAAATADAVCLSALMTTTLANMEKAVSAVREVAEVPVFVGGAVVTRDFADGLGAGYSEDAPGCVRAVRSALSAPKGNA
ncbi:MAG: homocysteine S-methyltransferase family protein [Coriobacteriia bacterium]|nr:homocysteine S-methyltransferase family protein [Coriobacteriia bacterium]